MTTLKYSGVILGIIAAIGIGAYLFLQKEIGNPDDLTKVAEEINERGVQVKPEDNENEVELDMTESEVQTYFHLMTHQHVKADKKWGAVESSPQNIKNLLTIVKANQDAYEYNQYYIEVLELWSEGNFSNAVSVHNTIWKWKGGTVGRATGLLSDEEKRKFVEENFNE